MEAIVLAGGRGTRLQSVVRDVPKPMAPVNGRPFLEFVLDGLKTVGFTRILLSVGYKREMIIDHFGDRYAGMDIIYAIEHTPLGTGGALRLAFETSGQDKMFVLNGDTFVPLDYRGMLDQHNATGGQLTIATANLPDVGRYGSIEVFGNRVTSLIEKGPSGPGLINAGTYLVEAALLRPYELNEPFSFEKEILEPMAHRGEIWAYPAGDYFIDIGIPEDYRRAQSELAQR